MYLLKSLSKLVFICCPFLFFFFLFIHSDPPGTDGYFYLTQIKYLAAENIFYYPDRSPAFFIPAFICAISGNPLLAFQISLAFFWSLVIVFVFLLTSKLSSNEHYCLSMMLILSLTVSQNFIEFSLNYFKNLAGIALLIPALLLYLKGNNYRKLAVPVFIIAVLTHKLVLLFGILFLTILFINQYKRGSFSLKALVFTVSNIILLLIIFLIFYKHSLPYLSHLSSYLTTPEQWISWISHKALYNPGFFSTMVSVIISIVLYAMARKHIDDTFISMLDFMALVIMIPLIPFQESDPMSPCYRLMLIWPVFSFPLLFITLNALIIKKRLKIILIFAVFALILIPNIIDFVMHHETYFPHWCTSADLKKIEKKVNHEDIIIAHHGLKFFITYVTGLKTTEYRPGSFSGKVYRVAYTPKGRPSGKERADLNSIRITKIDENYSLFSEDEWQRVSHRINLKPHWKNPNKEKPDHIY